MVDQKASLKNVQDIKLVISSFLIAIAVVWLLCTLFEPRWETNDDIGMSMVAHGYGLAAYGSPNLVFSNIIWGYIVRAIPTINGILGYSLATLGVLTLVGAVLFYTIKVSSYGYLTSLAIVLFVLVHPVLFPQFTINSGLLMVGAIACWHLYGLNSNWRPLFIGCVMAWLSYLVRSQEALLVFLVALPLIPWRTLTRNRMANIALLFLFLVITLSYFTDYQAYQGDEWQIFNELNPVRLPFTDFDAAAIARQNPEILGRYGFSTNDIDLISTWYFVDPEIANPKVLQAILNDLGSLLALERAFVNGWIGVQALWNPTLLPLSLAAFLLTILNPRWRLAASWALCIGAVFLLGFLGRPGLLRVYIPLVSLLVLAPLLKPYTSPWRFKQSIVTVLIATMLIINTSRVFSVSRITSAIETQIREELSTFPIYPVVIWGGVFPFEAMYPVLDGTASAIPYKLYALGALALAPFSVVTLEEKAGRGIKARLLAKDGVPIIANEKRFGFLQAYCRERLHGEIEELSVQQYGQIQVALPDLWLKPYWPIHFLFPAFAESLAVPRY